MFDGMRRLSLLLCLAALASAGSASAVLDGSFDGTAHPYVGAFTDGATLCTGFLVSPTVVVTAAHCFADGAAVRGSFAPAPNGATVFGTNHRDPSFCCEGSPQTADVAVVVLGKAQPGPYASLAPLGTFDQLSKKTQLTVVGYGTNVMTNGGGPPQQVYLGQRTTAQVALSNGGSKISQQFLKLASSASGNKPSPCFGDSGGPDLLPDSDTAVALTSYGSNQICSGPSYAFRLDTPEAQGFVSQFLP
jgi:secreted trypsin-like serine protease